MEFKKLKIADLVPASYNPRKALKPGDAEYEKIKNSITEFGYVDPVIVNDDMTVIGGHQRLTVLKDLGFEEIDCVVISVDKTKEKALNIALNKITGEWNKELLADLIKDLQDSDFDVAFTGFDPPEVEQLFSVVFLSLSVILFNYIINDRICCCLSHKLIFCTKEYKAMYTPYFTP